MLKTPEINISSGIVWRIALIILAIWFIYLIREVLILLFIALVIVSAAQPIVEKLEKKKIPRAVTTVILYIIGLTFLGGGIYLIIPIIVEEFQQLGKNIPQYFEGIGAFINNLTALAADYNFENNLQRLIENSSSRMTELFSQIFSNAFTFLGSIFKILLVLSLSFYMLVRKEGIKGFLRAITPKKHQEYAFDLTSRIQYKMGRWLIGQFTLIIIIFALDYLVLSSLGVPYALLLALLGGLFEIIPYIGPVMALIPAALVALTISPLTALLVIIFYIVIQQLENYVLTPLIMKKAVGLDPVVIILSLLIGGILAGFLGVLIAVPFATAISVFMNDLLEDKKKGEGLDKIKNA